MSKKNPKPDGEKKPTQAWARWPHEPPDAYAAALVFFTMTDRSIDGAWAEYARRHGSAADDPAVVGNREHRKGVSARWKWFDRAEAFDADRARLEAAAVERAASNHARLWADRYQRAREDDYDIAQALRHKAMEMLSCPLYQETATEVDPTTGAAVTVVREPAKWKTADIAVLLRIAYELQEGAFKAVMPNTESNQGPVSHEPPQAVQFDPAPVIIDVVRHAPRVLAAPDAAAPRRVIEASYEESPGS